MTFDKFQLLLTSKQVELLRDNKRLRKGQALMLALHHYDKELYNKANGTFADCFYSDHKMADFWAWLQARFPNQTCVVRTTVRVTLDAQQKDALMKFLNLAYLGEEECNHYVDGKLVGKYPEKEPALREAHYRAMRSTDVQLEVEFNTEGEIVSIKVPGITCKT